MTGVVIRDFAGLPHQRRVFQIPARDLLVQLLQTHEKRPVPVSRYRGLRHPKQVHVAHQHVQVGIRRLSRILVGHPIRHQEVHHQLQRRLPLHGLAQENDGLYRGKVGVHGSTGRVPAVFVDVVQAGEVLGEVLDGGDLSEAQFPGDVTEVALARDEDLFVVEVLEHAQRGVGQDDLLLGDVEADPSGEVGGLFAPGGVAAVGHEDCGDPELAVGAFEALEGLRDRG